MGGKVNLWSACFHILCPAVSSGETLGGSEGQIAEPSDIMLLEIMTEPVLVCSHQISDSSSGFSPIGDSLAHLYRAEVHQNKILLNQITGHSNRETQPYIFSMLEMHF